MYLVELFEGKVLSKKYLTKYELEAKSDVRKWEMKEDRVGRYIFVPEKI